MPKRKKPSQIIGKVLDTGLPKARRGRPGVSESEIVGRAENYRDLFWERRLNKKQKKWVKHKPFKWAVALAKAKTAEDVSETLDSASHFAQVEFKRQIPLILKVLKERTFLKKQKTQFGFLAESLAGLGVVSPRRSRDICAKERARERTKSPHRIIRKEFYVECSCGYKGPALNNSCRKCGAEIFLLPDILSG